MHIGRGSLVAVAAGICLSAYCRWGVTGETVPDFTTGVKPELTPSKQDRYLHLHGARGYVHLTEKNETTLSRQIYITLVPAGSLAGTVVRVGDVILGVNGKRFTQDALWTFRTACHTARRSDTPNEISIIRWRDGKVTEHTISLRPPPPDFTRGGEPDKTHDWTLGATGARGWIFARDLVTSEARQIFVTEVEPGTPADGKLAEGDVILGVEGKRFDQDARRAFAEALTEAEAADGRLRLTVWRGGVERVEVISLAVLGRYTASSPWDCPKAERIREACIDRLKRKGIGRGIAGYVNALGLLASGHPDVAEMVREFARKIAPNGSPDRGLHSWRMGYSNLFLCEYYLATRDAAVFEGVRTRSLAIAEGQSAVGTWGHRFARADDRLGGYGALNQAALPLTVSLVLARKCGIEEPSIDRAIDKAVAFFSRYIDYGPIPYGDHPTTPSAHDDNGKCSIAAVLFDLLGDERGATFFSRMTVASYNVREAGHTGNFFSFLWGPLAAARSGPKAAAAFMKELRWFCDFERKPDGSFLYQGAPGRAGAEHQYGGWDCTGARLLACGLPLKKLYLTGRGRSVARRLDGEELEEVVAAGRGVTWPRRERMYSHLDEETLCSMLSSWSPVVRWRAAAALGSTTPRVGAARLVGMLKAPSRSGRLGACEAIVRLGADAAPAVDGLLALARGDDVLLRTRAIHALIEIGRPARRVVPALLRLATETSPRDPKDLTQRALCNLFRRGFDTGFLEPEAVAALDRPLLCKAVARLLRNEDGAARTNAERALEALGREELTPLWPAVIETIRTPAPSGVMHASGVRLAGLQLMARHRIEEGIALAAWYVRHQNQWGAERRTERILNVLRSYGTEARAALDELERVKEYYDQPSIHARERKVKAIETAMSDIRNATETPVLYRIDGAKAR